VTTGKLIAPTVKLTRTEKDFPTHIAQIVALDPESGWIFAVDNLTTRESESLVR
jgi:hypothetical protein